tara:strand:- start:558 stop:872 length:315 start_codon:yes stop_codon:yes gene_type:complete
MAEYVHIELWRYKQFLEYKRTAEDVGSLVHITPDRYSDKHRVFTKDEALKRIIDRSVEFEEALRKSNSDNYKMGKKIEDLESLLSVYQRNEKVIKLPWYKRIFK